MLTPRGGVLVPPTPSPQGRQLFQKIIATEVRTKTAFVTDELFVENVNIMSAISALGGGGGGGAELASLSAFTNNVLAVNVSSLSQTVYTTTVSLSTTVGTLSTTVGTLSTAMGTLSGTVDTLSITVGTLSGTVGTLSTAVGTLSGSLATLSTAVGTLSGTVATLSTTVANLAASSGGVTVASTGGLAEISSGVGSTGFLAYYDFTNQVISLVENVNGGAFVSLPNLQIIEMAVSSTAGIRLKMSAQLTPAFTGFTFAARYAAPITESTQTVFQVGQNPGNATGCVIFTNDHRVKTGIGNVPFPGGQGNQFDGPTGLSFGPYRTLLVTYDPAGVMTAYDPSGNVKRTWTGLNLDNPTFPGQNYIACMNSRLLVQGLVLYNRPLNASEITKVYHALANTPIDPTAGLPSPAPGTVTLYAGTALSPIGSVPCDGSTLYRSTYSSLFTAIGTTFGSGNGSTTFNVPDYSAETKPTGTKYVIKL